jgi:RNA polymerase sigma-70 factor (ECF subfamily)
VDYQNKTDEELVKLTLKDSEMFYHLMQRYEQKLMRYVRYFSSIDEQSAEDVVQETFLNAYKSLNAFDPDMKFSSWIYRIARNETVDLLRKNSNGKKVISLDNGSEDDLQLIDVLKSDIDVLKDIKTKEIKEKVRAIVQTMPAEYRDVLILRYMEEKSYDEIGDILKKPSGTVAILISRAKSYFKDVAAKFELDSLI